MTSSTLARITNAASASSGVFWRLTTTNFFARSGRSAAGTMRSDVPSARQRSAPSKAAVAGPHSDSGRASSQSRTVSSIRAPQRQKRPVGLSATPPRSQSCTASAPHASQRSVKTQPWRMPSLARVRPLRRSRPSTFCVAQKASRPRRSSATSAMCVGVGAAASNDAPAGASPSSSSAAPRRRFLRSSRVQMPRGPRKSGRPAAVEMPAPVSATIVSLASKSSTSCASLRWSTRAESAFSAMPVTPLSAYSERRDA
mmetsp:Transcript_2021/g.6132  ORF Transcript_2021/g.6132 Transcript_2021/m.6132 type:complete len:256 (+) Transcript_2021:571-1338(+)